MELVKPNGTKIEINDHPDNIAKAKELGWKSPDEAEKPKRSAAKEKSEELEPEAQ